MELSVSTLVLVAQQHEIEELRRLSARAQLVGAIGHMVHALQGERGATGVFLSSQGERFQAMRESLVEASHAAEAALRERFGCELQAPTGGARLYTLMARAQLELEALPALRQRIGAQQLAGPEAVQAFTRVIGALVSLIFEVADAAVDPGVSRLLVALFNLVQGKELAGQERALGGLCFASGRCEAADQERLGYLIDAQERCFQLFADFAEPPQVAAWKDLQDAPHVVQLERLRRTLFSTRVGRPPDGALDAPWFDACSQRLVAIGSIQVELVERLQARCEQLIVEAERQLHDVEGLLTRLREAPSVDAALRAPEAPGTGQPMVQVLRAQSERLATMQSDLDAARRALDERKIIERAKGVLMERFQINEDAAHVMMRKTAMDRNLRLVDVAQAGLSLPTFLPPGKAKA